MSHHHESHKAVIQRLKRANGHMASVIKMLENEKPCPEILQQMSAVIAAFVKARKIVFEDHLQHCIVDSVRNGDSEKALSELNQMLKMMV
jgi:DNA-binding FrmR family transcriptional regulator